MIVYTENPMDSTKKLPDLVKKNGEKVGYKVNNQESKAFCIPTMKYQKEKSGKKIPI